tara:strand:- start:90 stop:626 length:537 start_codon:yes stop_codon:yes gene_type:complete
MKFLIFNILVFFALGYLLTSNSNQNFKSWFIDKKDQITNLSKKDYVDKLNTAISSNTDNSAKKNLIENRINNEEKFQKEILTQIKKLNEKINQNTEDLIKPEKIISQNNVLSKELNDQKVQKEKLEKEVDNLPIEDTKFQNFEKNKIENKFLTPQQRGQALAEIITDLEIYSIKGILN